MVAYVLSFGSTRETGPAGLMREDSTQCLATLIAVLVLVAALVDAPLGIIATSSSAIADDIFTRAHSQAYNWTGLYVGGHVGGAWANNDWFFPYDSINSVAHNPISSPSNLSFRNSPSGLRDALQTGYQLPTVGPFNVSSGSNSASNLLAGVQIGYNYQINNWVLGVEGEASWAGLQGSNLDPSFTNINHTDTDFIGVLAGRLGYAWDRVLLYGKAGGAWAHDKYSVYTNTTFTVGSGSPAPVTVTTGTMVDAATVNRFGYMLGAGVEYALSPQWSVKAEYQYLEFGWQRTTLTPTTTVVSPFDEDILQRIQLFEIGFNYKLDPALGAASAPAHPLFDQVGQFDPHRLYGGAEYLLWWVKGAPLSVPLVTTGQESNHYGIINSSQTTILYGAPMSPGVGGNETQNFDALSGIRLLLGYWFDDAQRFAIEAGGFALQKAEADYYVSSDSTGSPGLSIPEYNGLLYLPEGRCGFGPHCGTGIGEDRSPAAIPNELVGSIAIKNTLQLWGLHANATVSVIRTSNWSVTALGGFRYLNLSEDFNLYSSITGISGSPFAGQSGYTDDDFATRNQFYGALLGLRARGVHGPFSLETTLTAALGVNHETISINGYYQAYGYSIVSDHGPYGIFATPANEGATSSNKFAVVPEVQVKLGYDITPKLRVTVGYNFLYWSNVVRPTDQIDRNLVKGQFYQEDPFSTSLDYPQRLDKTTDFYVQGVTVGLSARF